jgi:hypothetical protein
MALLTCYSSFSAMLLCELVKSPILADFSLAHGALPLEVIAKQIFKQKLGKIFRLWLAMTHVNR